MRISNCSRDFLSICGERRTQYLLILVGSGMGQLLWPQCAGRIYDPPADWSSSFRIVRLSRYRLQAPPLHMALWRLSFLLNIWSTLAPTSTAAFADGEESPCCQRRPWVMSLIPSDVVAGITISTIGATTMPVTSVGAEIELRDGSW